MMLHYSTCGGEFCSIDVLLRTAVRDFEKHWGCRHDPRATLMVYVFISATLGFIGVPLLHRRVKQGYFPHKGLHHSLCFLASDKWHSG
jgi:hypothetical protein